MELVLFVGLYICRLLLIRKNHLIGRLKSNLLPLPERITGATVGNYLKRRESWKQQKADMKRLQGTNITCYSLRHYYALLCHLKLIDSGSASLSMGYSIEAH